MRPVSLRRQDDRRIPGVQGGCNVARKAVDKSRVIRTEENLVTTWNRSIGRFGKRDAATYESLAREDRVDRGRQVCPGGCLLNVTRAPQTERHLHDIRRG